VTPGWRLKPSLQSARPPKDPEFQALASNGSAHVQPVLWFSFHKQKAHRQLELAMGFCTGLLKL